MTTDQLFAQIEKTVTANKYAYDTLLYHLVDFVQANRHQNIQSSVFKDLSRPLAKGQLLPPQKHRAQLMARFFTDEVLLKLYFEQQPSEEQSLISLLTWEQVVHYRQAKSLFGRDLLVFFKNIINDPQLIPQMAHWRPFLDQGMIYNFEAQSRFTLAEKIDEKGITFNMPGPFREAFARILPLPKSGTFQEISLSKAWTVSRFEETIFEELPRILHLISRGDIKITKSGHINLTNVKSQQRAMALKTFPTDIGYIKTLLIAGFIFSAEEILSRPDPVDRIRYIFNEQPGTYAMIDALMFPFDEFRNIDNAYINPGAFRSVMDLIRHLPEGRWITEENLQTYARSHYFNLEVVDDVKNFDLMAGEYCLFPGDFYEGAIPIRQKIVTETFVSSMIIAAAVFGLVDLAFEKKRPHMPLDNFSACRLTALGAHVLQNKPGYEMPEGAKPVRFHLDQSALQIKVEGKMAIAQRLLGDWTKQQGADILAVDPEKIIERCQLTEDLERSIRQFTKAIGTPLPDFWKVKLMEMIDQASAVRPINNIRVYTLRPEDKRLHQLMIRDKILGKLTRKAEDYMIIVGTEDNSKFCKRLAQLGYVIEPNLLPYTESRPKLPLIRSAEDDQSYIAKYNEIFSH